MSEENGGGGVTVFVWEILCKISLKLVFVLIFQGEPGESSFKSNKF